MISDYKDNPIIKELAKMNIPNATRARYCLLNGFRHRGLSDNLYDLSRTPRSNLLRIRNLGPGTLLVIGEALQNLGVIKDGIDWATAKKVKNTNISLRSIDKKLDIILEIIKKGNRTNGK